jgi:hypothetical protein
MSFGILVCSIVFHLNYRLLPAPPPAPPSLSARLTTSPIPAASCSSSNARISSLESHRLSTHSSPLPRRRNYHGGALPPRLAEGRLLRRPARLRHHAVPLGRGLAGPRVCEQDRSAQRNNCAASSSSSITRRRNGKGKASTDLTLKITLAGSYVI